MKNVGELILAVVDGKMNEHRNEVSLLATKMDALCARSLPSYILVPKLLGRSMNRSVSNITRVVISVFITEFVVNLF
uniref:Uncharacterized protein n=2 Tax=Anguilla anguilla TaxID=7936 RepID=A0A0E9V376_ANGAN